MGKVKARRIMNRGRVLEKLGGSVTPLFRVSRVRCVGQRLIGSLPPEHLRQTLPQPPAHLPDRTRPETIATGHADGPEHQRRIHGKLLGEQLRRKGLVVGEEDVEQHGSRAIRHGQHGSAGAGDECR